MESKLGQSVKMKLETNHSEGHKEYLLQRAKDYKSELEMMLGSTKNTALPGREYCKQCDPRFRVLQTPEKKQEITYCYNNNSVSTSFSKNLLNLSLDYSNLY